MRLLPVVLCALLAAACGGDPHDGSPPDGASGGDLAALEGGPNQADASVDPEQIGGDATPPSGSDGGAGDDVGSGADGAVDAEQQGELAPGCSWPGLEPGTHERKLEHDGLERFYDVHVPAGYESDKPTPVVLYFHPLGMTKHYLKAVGGPEKADQEGFIAVFPQGRGNSWNAGACCAPANGANFTEPVDDVGFVRALLAELSQLLCVDPKRIYATGFSNGGFISHRLACEAADLVAAVAPVSSVNGMEDEACTPARPVPVLMINGTEDGLVPYEGGFSFWGVTNGSFISVADSFAGWAQRNGCTDEPHETMQQGDVSCQSHTECQQGAVVTQCTVDGGGHCWYGESFCYLGSNTENIAAIDASWAFFVEHPLP